MTQNFGIAGQILSDYYGSVQEDADAESKLRAAWNAVKGHEAAIERFIDNKVTPYGIAHQLPELATLKQIGGDKNSIDYNGIKVVFNDGSGITMSKPTFSFASAISDSYPVKTFTP